MADKFWQQSSFRDFVSGIKKPTTPAPTGTGSGGIGGQVATQPRNAPAVVAQGGIAQTTKPFISPTLDILLPTRSGEFTLGQEAGTKLNQQAIASPVRQEIAPDWFSGIKIGDRMYYDKVNNQYTSISGTNTYPVYFDDYGTMVIDPNKSSNPTPTYLTPELADQFYQYYQVSGLSERTRTTFEQMSANVPTITAEMLKDEMSGLDSWRIDDTKNTFWYTDSSGNEKPITFMKGNILTPLQVADNLLKKLLVWQTQPYNTRLSRIVGSGVITAKRLLGNIVRYTLSNRYSISPDKLRPLYDKNIYESIQTPDGLLAYAKKHKVDVIALSSMPIYLPHKEFTTQLSAGQQWWDETGEGGASESIRQNNTALLSQFVETIKSPADVENFGDEPLLFTKGKMESQLQMESLVQAANLHNEAYPLFVAGDVKQAIELKKQAYNLQNAYGVGANADFAYTFWGDTELYDQYLTAKAVIELQRNNQPLNQFESRQLQSRFTDPTIEIVGEVAFGDMSDIITATKIGKVPAFLGAQSENFVKFTSKYIGDLSDMNITQLIFNTTKGAVNWAADAAKLSDSSLVRGAVGVITRAGGLFKASSRQLAKNAVIDVDNVIRGLVKGEDIVGNPQEFVTTFNKLGLDVQTLKNESLLNGITPTAEDISIKLRGSGQYAPQLTTVSRVKALMSLTAEINPLEAKSSWADVADGAYTKSLKYHENVFEEQLTNTANTIIRNNPDITSEEASRLLQEAQVEAKKAAKDVLRGVDLSTEIGNKFREAVIEKHKAWLGSSVLDSSLSGYIGKKLGEAFGEGNRGVTVYRGIVDGWTDFWSLYFGAWVRNVVVAPFRFFGVYSPTENLSMYSATRGGSIFGSVRNLVDNSPDLLRRIESIPVEGRTGFSGGVFSLESEMREGGSMSLINLLKANPTSWVATPGNTTTLFIKNVKSRWTNWLETMADTTGDVKLLKKIKEGVGVIGLPLGAWTDTSKAISGSGELIVKATIADEKYLSNLSKVSETVRIDLTNTGRDILQKAGASEAQISDWVSLNDEMWERARGSATEYAKLMDFSLTNTPTNEAIMSVPREIRNLDLGLSPSEHDALLRSINENKNIALTAFRNSNGRVPTPEEVHDIFDEIGKSITASVDEATNAEGLVGTSIFGQIHTTRPVSNNTRKLLDMFESGEFKAPTSVPTMITNKMKSDLKELGYSSDDISKMTPQQAWNVLGKQATDNIKIGNQTLSEILEDNNALPTEGQSISDAVEELHKILRPGVASQTTFSDGAVGLIQKYKLNPDASFELNSATKKALAEHNIKIPDSKESLNESVRELVGKYDGIYSTDGVPPATIEALYKGGDTPVSDDLVSEMGKVTYTRPTDASKWEDILRAKEARPDIPNTLWEAKDNVRMAQGKFQGRLKQLNEVIAQNPDNLDAVQLRTKLDTFRSRFDSYQFYMNQWLQNVFPGYVTTKSRTGFKQAQAMWENYYNRSAEYFNELTDALSRPGGSIVPEISQKEYLRRFWDVDMSFDENNNPLFYIKNPITNVWQEFPSMVSPEGRVIVDYRMSRLMQDSYLGLNNNNVLNASMFSPDEEIVTLRNKTPLPYFAVPPERIPAEQKGFFDAMISKRQVVNGGDTYKMYIMRTLNKSADDIDKMSPDEVIKALTKKVGRRTDESAEIIRKFVGELQEGLDYYTTNFLTGNMRVMSSLPTTMHADETRAWANHTLKQATSHEAIQDMLGKWEADTVARVDNGTAFLKSEDIAQDVATRKANTAVLEKIADAEQKLWDGGVINGVSLEGAIPYMRTMMRVPKESVLDQFMRNIVPFWMFATRGSRAWLRVALDHPEWVFAYARYRRFSEASAYKEGMIDSKGRVLPSKVGKIPINILGQQVWAAADSAMPFFRYILTPNRTEGYDYQEVESDAGWLENFITWARGGSELRGISVNPILDIALHIKGIPDPYSNWTPEQLITYYGISAFVPPDLLPPNVWNYVTSVINSLNGSEVPNAEAPRVKWFDPLVEVHILEKLLQDMESEVGQNAKMELALHAMDVISGREDNDEYNQAVKEVQDKGYYKQLAGWFFGIYADPVSPALAERNAIRDQRNLLIAAANSELVSQVFYPDTAAGDLYDLYVDDFMNSPKGQLYNIYRATNWVTDEKGNLVEDKEPRRNQIDINFEQMTQTRAMYDLIQIERDTYTDLERSYPIGAAYREPLLVEARKQMYNNIAEIEMNPQYYLADRAWSAGIKPRELVDQHFENMWWYMLTKSRPSYADFKDAAEYELADKKWRENLPKDAELLAPIMMTNIIPSVATRTNANGVPTLNIDPERIMKYLISTANSDGYDAWDVSHIKSVDVAVANSWYEMYLRDYIRQSEAIEGKFAKQQFYEQFKVTNPPPTDDEIVQFIFDKFGEDKFSEKEIRKALVTPEYRPARSAQGSDTFLLAESKMEQQPRERLTTEEYFRTVETQIERDYQDVWNIHTWSKLGGTTELRQAFISVGGNMNQWDAFYNLEGAEAIPYNSEFKDETTFRSFLSKLQQAAALANISKPSTTELGVIVVAEQQDIQFKKMVSQQLGDTFLDEIYYPYSGMSSSDKRVFQKTRPEDYAKIQFYWKMRDQYTIQYPAWAQYYNASSSGGAKYYGYSGRSSRRSGGKSVARSGGQFVPIGMRSTEDANQLLSPENLGKGGVSGMPSLPQKFWEKTTIDLRSEIYRFVNGEAELSTAARGFLSRQAERYAEYKPEIDKLLAETNVEAEA